MEYLLTGSEMTACDLRTSGVIGIPSLVLMERAALSVADGADEYLRKKNNPRGPVLVAAGRGNNGADGLAAGRILIDRGYNVQFFRLAGEVSPGSSFAVQEGILNQYGSSVDIFSSEKYPSSGEPEGLEKPAVIIDALFGTGLSRALQGQAAEAVAFLNACRTRCASYTIAVDIPSGISSDDGSVMGCAVVCDETRTFAFLKRGHLMHPGTIYAGRRHLAQIGITSRAFEKKPGMFTLGAEEAAELIPPRSSGGNKGTFGKVLIIAGRRNMCGAALLAGRACLSSGAGMVKIFTHEANRVIVQQQFPEAMLETFQEDDPADVTVGKLVSSLKWADIAAAGPAMGTDRTAADILRTILRYEGSNLRGLILDADAIRIIADNYGMRILLAGRLRDLPCILTPHLAEFAALAGLSVGECARDRARIVQETADALRCTIICKDARTLVACPSRDEAPLLYLNCTGNSGMATAGSGDVLTGMTAAYLAAFRRAVGNENVLRCRFPGAGDETPRNICEGKTAGETVVFSEREHAEGFDAAVCAVCLHGAVGDLAREAHGERGMTAMDLIDVIRSGALEK